ATEKPPARLRVMHFLHAKTLNVKHNSLWWGIASSDVPTSGTPDPASARICFIREGSRFDQAGYIENTVSYVEMDELISEPHGTIIRRLIDNRITALSVGHSINPQAISDLVLRVDQATAERASDAIFDDRIDWAKNP